MYRNVLVAEDELRPDPNDLAPDSSPSSEVLADQSDKLTHSLSACPTRQIPSIG
jgi:hypothetical protein